MLKPISVKQFLIKFNGEIDSLFSSCQGGKVSRVEDTYNDGKTGTVQTHLSFTQRDKLTLSKNFDPEADKALVSWLDKQINGDKISKLTLAIQPVNTDLAGTILSGAGTFLVNGCQLMSWQIPQTDREGTGLAKLQLEFIWETITYQ